MPACPRPMHGEQVTLWVQNSQPCAIPAGAIGLNLMGDDKSATLDHALAPFASHALDVASLLPDGALAAADRDQRRQIHGAAALRDRAAR